MTDQDEHERMMVAQDNLLRNYNSSVDHPIDPLLLGKSSINPFPGNFATHSRTQMYPSHVSPVLHTKHKTQVQPVRCFGESEVRRPIYSFKEMWESSTDKDQWDYAMDVYNDALDIDIDFK